MLHHQQTLTRIEWSFSDAAKRSNSSSAASHGSPQTLAQTCPPQCRSLNPTAAVQTNITSRLPSTCSDTSAPPSHKTPPTTPPCRLPHKPTFTTPLTTTVKRTLTLLLPRLTSHSRASATQPGASRLKMPLTTGLKFNYSSTAS